MRMFVPTVGTKIKLLQDWSFKMQGERRNDSMMDAAGIAPTSTRSWQRFEGDFNFTLPAGTMLKYDRIYIRKGNSSMDSVTFCVVACPDLRFVGKKLGGTFTGRPAQARFWVKREFANKIYAEILAEE